MASFRFTVEVNKELESKLRRHFGARRFAYNRCLAEVKRALDAHRRDGEIEVPWSGFDLINFFNAWKVCEEAGRCFAVDPAGQASLVSKGLHWRNEICAQVFEEAAQDLGRALRAFSASRRASRGRTVGFPHFQKMGQHDSFRLRNKVSQSGRHSIRVGGAGPRILTLPVIGTLAVREDTRRLRRMLRSERARICHATVAVRQSRAVVTLTCELADFHPAMQQRDEPHRFVGIDRGLTSLLVLADAERREIGRVEPPRHLGQLLPRIRRQSRVVARRKLGSSNRRKAVAALARLHGTVANRRNNFTHQVSSEIAKSHGALCLEELAVQNLMKNRHLARAIGDAAWGELGRMLTYKANWYGAELHVAPRFFPSTKTCSSCGTIRTTMTLSERIFGARAAGCKSIAT